jgi:glycosyltransferase involved in cell wall biosynthesis
VAAPSSLRCLVATVDLDVGGMGEVVASLVRGLPGQGIDTSVLHLGSTAPNDPGRGSAGRLAQELREQGVPVAFVETEADGRRWLADNRPDVISAHIAPDWLFAAADGLGIPVVETLHMAAMPGAASSDVARRRGATRFVTVSEVVREHLLASHPDLGADRVVAIPHGVAVEGLPDVDREEIRARLGIRDELLFVSLARYSLEKNPYGLVQAFEEFARSHPEAHLLVAGRVDDPAYAQQVRRLADRSQAAPHIHLRDHLPHPAALLAAADAVVVDSFFEGGPLVSMEALCMGTPVIMSDVGRAREHVGPDGRGGHVVPNPLGDLPITWETIRTARFGPQANRGALVGAMEAVARERDRWAAERTGLAHDSRHRFDIDRCLQQHAAILTGAAAGHGARLA